MTAPNHCTPKKPFNEIFKVYEAKTGKKLEIAYIPVPELDARLAVNSQDFVALLHKLWVTRGPFLQTDNHLYLDWNPSFVLDYLDEAEELFHSNNMYICQMSGLISSLFGRSVRLGTVTH